MTAEIITEIESLLERATPGNPRVEDWSESDYELASMLTESAPLLLAALRFGVAWREWDSPKAFPQEAEPLFCAVSAARESLYAELEKAR